MNWIDEQNKRMEESRNLKKEAGLNEKLLNQMQGRWEGGKNSTGPITDWHRKKLSEAKIGKKRNKDSVERSINGLKQTWIEKMASIHSVESIKEAQMINGNHQANTCKYLKITFHTYKKLLNYYGLEQKKKSKVEKAEFAKTKQSTPVLVWKEGKNGKPIGKPTEYYSVSECCRTLGLPNKGRMLEKMSKGLPYHGYFFRKVNDNLEI